MANPSTQSPGNRVHSRSFYLHERADTPKAYLSFALRAGALGFRDFSGLLAAKENRTGSR
jgi:hypothetical protein